MKHTYICRYTYIDTDWHSAHEEDVQLLQNKQPCITDIKAVILFDIRKQVEQSAHKFVEDCFDKKRLTSKEAPATFFLPIPEDVKANYPEKDWDAIRNSITCYWKNDSFCVSKENPILDYSTYYTYNIREIDDNEVVFLPKANWHFGLKFGNTQSRIFTTEQFSSYDDAHNWLSNFLNANYFKKYDKPRYDCIDICVTSKKDLVENLWYKSQIEIMNETGECTERFFEEFTPYTLQMYYKLFNKYPDGYKEEK